MTDKEALERCIRMWNELAETGSTNKTNTEEYFRNKRLCALCDRAHAVHRLAQSSTKHECYYCLLKDNWGDKRQARCVSDGSWYSLWLEAWRSPQRKIYAAKIASAAKSALRKLNA